MRLMENLGESAPFTAMKPTLIFKANSAKFVIITLFVRPDKAFIPFF